jgi:deoxycytidylate deaminase
VSKKRYVIVSTAYDAKGHVIASRINDYQKTHPLQKHFAKLAGEPFKESLHSEIATLIACKDKQVRTLVIVRFDSEGNFKDCMPCRTCRTAIKAYNVQRVLYSTPEGMKEL